MTNKHLTPVLNPVHPENRDLDLEERLLQPLAENGVSYPLILGFMQDRWPKGLSMLRNLYPDSQKVVFPWVLPSPIYHSDCYSSVETYQIRQLASGSLLGLQSHLFVLGGIDGGYTGGYFVAPTAPPLLAPIVVPAAVVPPSVVPEEEQTPIIKGAHYFHDEDQGRGCVVRLLGEAAMYYKFDTYLLDKYLVYETPDGCLHITTTKDFTSRDSKGNPKFTHLPSYKP